MLQIVIGGIFSSLGVARPPPGLRPVWWRYLLTNMTQTIVFGYASWFWIAGVNSEHFQQVRECDPIIFFFARISGGAFQGLKIFFAVLSVILTASWAFGLLFYCEDVFAFAKANLMPLSQAVKEELLEHINTACHESLVSILSHDSGLPSSGASSVRLEDIRYTYLAIASGPGGKRVLIRLDRPLLDMRNKEKVQKRIHKMATIRTILTLDDNDEDEEFTFSKFWEVVSSVFGAAPDKFFSGLDENVFNIFKLCFHCLSFAFAVYTILAVELMIKWNGISGVYTVRTTGQLIPFVIGVIGLFKALHDVNFKFEVSTPHLMHTIGLT